MTLPIFYQFTLESIVIYFLPDFNPASFFSFSFKILESHFMDEVSLIMVMILPWKC